MLCCVSPDPTPQFIQFAFVWAACLHLTFPYITYKRKIPSNSGSLWHYPGRWSHGNLFIGGPKGPMVVTSRFQNLKAASLDSLLLRLKRSQPSPNPSQRKWNQHLVLVVQTRGMSDSWQHCHWPRVRRCHQWAILSVVSSSLLLSHSPFGRQSQYSEVFFVAYHYLPLRLTERRVWWRSPSYSPHEDGHRQFESCMGQLHVEKNVSVTTRYNPYSAHGSADVCSCLQAGLGERLRMCQCKRRIPNVKTHGTSTGGCILVTGNQASMCF